MAQYLIDIIEEDVITCEICEKKFKTSETTTDDFLFAWDNQVNCDCCSECAEVK